MKFVIISVFLILFIFSCKEEKVNEVVINKIKSKKNNIDSSKQNKVPKVDKIIFYNFLDSTFKSKDYIHEAKELEASKVNDLLDLLYSDSSPRYLGAGTQVPAFHLFKNNKLVQIFHVDKIKNTYLLFKRFHVLKELDSIKLSTLLYEGEDIKSYYLEFENVNDARAILKSASLYDTPIIHSNEYAEPKWIQFEGEFVFSYHCLAKNQNNDSIFNLLETKLGKSNYNITYPQSLINKDSVKLSYRIYCNQNVYDNFKKEFNSFEYISSLNQFKPYFTLFCSESEYKKIKTSASTSDCCTTLK